MSHHSDSPARTVSADRDLSLRPVDAEGFLALVDEFIGIYSAAMGYPAEQASGRRQLWEQHALRDGFSCVAVFEGRGHPVAFAYGYSGRRGQWWNTEVARGVRGTPAEAWLADYAELTELHVRPDHQGHGLGERTLRAFLASRTESQVLLSTPEGDNRAWRLYRRLGFQDVLRSYRFTGDARPFGILGLVLPV